MRSTTLFGIYAIVIVGFFCGLAALTLFSLEKSRYWDARTQLAQESFGLHLRLEADVYRLFKEHGDALLIGDRDGGDLQRVLRDKIARTLTDIRTVIAQEIQMAGDEELEELAHLDEIENDIRAINEAVATLTTSGDPIDTFVQIERLAALLDGDIDVELNRKIEAALAEEQSEVEEVIREAAAFRASNQRLVFAIVVAAFGALVVGLFSFNAQIRQPIVRLREGLQRLRDAEYGTPVDLGGSREFQDLGAVLSNMGEALAAREASREDQRRALEEAVAARTVELQRLIDRLETGEENRIQLMADISHELRTPLAIILGEADVTLRTSTAIDEEVSNSLARIRESARHTNQIVDDMLTVARQEAGQLRLDRKEHDLRKIIHDAVSMFPGSVHVDIPQAQAFAAVDEVRLRQSILALLQNARRYGGPTISVSLADAAEARVIAVEDDGPGLSPSEKSQAFDRFFRGSNASGQGVEGSGLGLPVVKSIVEAHNGSVALEDREAGGLRVVITLPRERQMRVVSSDLLQDAPQDNGTRTPPSLVPELPLSQSRRRLP